MFLKRACFDTLACPFLNARFRPSKGKRIRGRHHKVEFRLQAAPRHTSEMLLFFTRVRKAHIIALPHFLEDWVLYSGGTDSFENVTAEDPSPTRSSCRLPFVYQKEWFWAARKGEGALGQQIASGEGARTGRWARESSRGNTIWGKRTESFWEGNLPQRTSENLWKISECLWKNLWKPPKTSENPVRDPHRDPLRGRFPSQKLSVLLPLIIESLFSDTSEDTAFQQ